MKKKFVLLYSWIIISVICQLLIYLFIDNVYLKGRENIVANIKVTTVDSTGSTPMVKEEPETSIDIPANAKSIEVSFDGTYIAYIMNGKLYIVDVSTREIKKIVENKFMSKDISQNNGEANITCFKWISNKNIIMYGLSALKEAPGKVQIFTYDVEAGNEHIGVVFTENYVPKGGELTDLVISPLTMVFYAKIKTNDTQERLFRIDLMDQMFPSITINYNNATEIGYFSEDLVYEDGNGKLYVKSGFKSPYQIKSGGNVALLGVVGVQKDGKDRIYVGQLNHENKVDKVFFGGQASDMSSWQSITLDKPLQPKNFVIKGDDVIYGINQDESIALNIQSGNKVEFKGDFVDIVNNHIVYLHKKTLKFRPLNKK